MIRYSKGLRVLALGFAALAGFIDAIGFLKSGGLFVSFMSGNSTRLAIGLAGLGAWTIIAAALIALFVLGVVANVLISGSATASHRKALAAAIVAILLIDAAILQSFGLHIPVVGTLCVAMGASNAIFQREGEVSIGVTYMTGTLVKLGYRLADALRGGDRTACLPYLTLWLALVVGGVAGALAFLRAPTASLWGAAAFSIVLAGACYRLTRGESRVLR